MVAISRITLILAVMLPSVMGAVGNGGTSHQPTHSKLVRIFTNPWRRIGQCKTQADCYECDPGSKRQLGCYRKFRLQNTDLNLGREF